MYLLMPTVSDCVRKRKNSDMNSELSVDPNTDWSEYYPKGAEIQRYWEAVVERNGLKDSVHLKREVIGAKWNRETNQWAVEVKNLENGKVSVDTAEFLVSAQGRISIPKHPDIEGLYDHFGGDVIHTAKWPSGFELKGKRVAVIGNGASGQQLVPNILAQVSRLDHYVRTKTWVTATFARGLHEATAEAPGGPKYTEEEKKRFREDPAAYLEHRRHFALEFQQPPGRETIGSKSNNELRERIIDTMRHRLDGDEEWLQRVLPDYAPGCKRLTPAPGYLEALRHEKVDYITDPILQVDKTGIITADGKHREVDVIITATGFELGFTSLFPVFGRDGIDLRDKWGAEGDIGYPESYLGLMAPGCPNYFTILQVSAWIGCLQRGKKLIMRHRLKEMRVEALSPYSARLRRHTLPNASAKYRPKATSHLSHGKTQQRSSTTLRTAILMARCFGINVIVGSNLVRAPPVWSSRGQGLITTVRTFCEILDGRTSSLNGNLEPSEIGSNTSVMALPFVKLANVTMRT